jgi:hypothetical protein
LTHDFQMDLEMACYFDLQDLAGRMTPFLCDPGTGFKGGWF